MSDYPTASTEAHEGARSTRCIWVVAANASAKQFLAHSLDDFLKIPRSTRNPWWIYHIVFPRRT